MHLKYCCVHFWHVGLLAVAFCVLAGAMEQCCRMSREVVEWGRRTARVALKSSKVGIRSVLVSVSLVEMRAEPRTTRVARRRSLRKVKLECIVVAGGVGWDSRSVWFWWV
jgi:hypothetical protein